MAMGRRKRDRQEALFISSQDLPKEADQKPCDEEIRRYDRRRKDKKVSNEDWVLSMASESRITRMKGGRTHLAYKAEHMVDLESDLVLAAEIGKADQADTQTLVDSVVAAQGHVHEVCGTMPTKEVVTDKGYHSASTLELADAYSFRTDIPEPKRTHPWRWIDKPSEYRRCVENNRRRVRRCKSKRLQKRRSERCERTFAPICDTGGMRRSWLRGVEDVSKRYTIAAAAHNMGRILRSLIGVGKPRILQGEGEASPPVPGLISAVLAFVTHRVVPLRPIASPRLLAA